MWQRVLAFFSVPLSSVVAGFCFGGITHALFGRKEGLSDLGALFNGAIVGAIVGLLVATAIVIRATPKQALVAAGIAAAAGAFVALATFVLVAGFGLW